MSAGLRKTRKQSCALRAVIAKEFRYGDLLRVRTGRAQPWASVASDFKQRVLGQEDDAEGRRLLVAMPNWDLKIHARWDHLLGNYKAMRHQAKNSPSN